MTRRVLIVSGSGRHADQWHDCPATTAAAAAVLAELGLDVSTSTDVDASLAELDGTLDLLVVNASHAPDQPADPAAELRIEAGLSRHTAAGRSVLAVHSAALALPAVAGWEALMGGRWIQGTTMHPPIGRSHVVVHPERHPVVAAATDFDLVDERYSYLRVADDVTVLASHHHDDLEHPLIWARQHGRSRVVYDALGHDVRSYESEEHRALLAAAARWLLEASPALGR